MYHVILVLLVSLMVGCAQSQTKTKAKQSQNVGKNYYEITNAEIRALKTLSSVSSSSSSSTSLSSTAFGSVIESDHPWKAAILTK
jgi:hypothetical protein